MEKAITKAMEGGYKLPDIHELFRGETIFGLPWYFHCGLDPLFWSCLGKALGWPVWFNNKQRYYVYKWHLFIDHIDSLKDADSYFNELLQPITYSRPTIEMWELAIIEREVFSASESDVARTISMTREGDILTVGGKKWTIINNK